MLKRKNASNPAIDERIQKESNKLLSKLFYLLNAILFVVLVIKLAQGVHWGFMVLDTLCLVGGIFFVVIQQMRKGILFLKKKDEVLTEIHHDILAKGYLLEMMLIIYGELVCMYIYRENIGWASVYFFQWIIPGMIHVVYSIKNSWIQWGGKKRQTVGKKMSKKMCAIAGGLFGVLNAFMELPTWLEDRVVSLKEAIWIPIEMVAFAILFYFIINFMIDKGEKRANKMSPENEEEMTLEE